MVCLDGSLGRGERPSTQDLKATTVAALPNDELMPRGEAALALPPVGRGRGPRPPEIIELRSQQLANKNKNLQIY